MQFYSNVLYRKWFLAKVVFYIIPIFILFSNNHNALAQKTDSINQAKKKLHRSQLYMKNNFFIGTSFGSSNRNAEDLDLQFFTIDNLTRSGSNIRIEGGYFIKNNWALGMVTRYSRTKTNIDFLSVEGTPTVFQGAGERYALYLTSKNFLLTGADSRFVVFANSMLGGSWRNQVSETLSGGLLQRSFSESKQIELVIQPGVSFNVIKGLNVELAMELASLGGEWSQSYLNGDPTSNSNRFRGNFSFNVLRTSFGIFYYFNTYVKRRQHEK
jgi:hypothetical protein